QRGSTAAAGEQRVDDHEADAQIGAGERRSRVEPEPAEGEDKRAEADNHQVVRRHRLGLAVDVLADARTDDDRSRQGDDAPHGVHYARAGEVDSAVAKAPVETALRKPAAAPDPVGIEA